MSIKNILSGVESMDDLIALVETAYKHRTPVAYGVSKVEGVSLQKTRRTANDAAVQLLNELGPNVDGNSLTDGQRAILAKYTGENEFNTLAWVIAKSVSKENLVADINRVRK